MNNAIKDILHISYEVYPFFKSGGLGDVLGSLPNVLGKHDLNNVVLSFYYDNRMNGLDGLKRHHFTVVVDNHCLDFFYITRCVNGVRYYFISPEDLHVFTSDEDSLANTYVGSESTNSYFYLSRAIHELIDIEGLYPDIIFFHDWHSLAYLAFTERVERKRMTHDFKSVYTIHNYHYQGEIFEPTLSAINSECKDVVDEIYTQFGSVSLASVGLKHSDYILTVSQSYADELLSGRSSHAGMKYFSMVDKDRVYAIANGIDSSFWSPASSEHVQFNYDVESYREHKRENKEHVFTGKFDNLENPVILFMARLTEQKGTTLLFNPLLSKSDNLENIRRIIDLGVNIVIYGVPQGGEHTATHKNFNLLQSTFQGQLIYDSKYTESKAHQYLSAADMLLCPSLFEPCGLTQLYAMNFGTVPLVTATGGLKDTVSNYFENPAESTGFHIPRFSISSILETVDGALQVYRDRDEWMAIVRRGMRKDFSWDKQALEYLRFIRTIEEQSRPSITYECEEALEVAD